MKDVNVTNFARKEEVRPIDYLVGAAVGWGGLPQRAAFYVMGRVDKNDGKTPYELTVEDVPVNAFWSVIVYNADGYLDANEQGVNSYNNFSPSPTRTTLTLSILVGVVTAVPTASPSPPAGTTPFACTNHAPKSLMVHGASQRRNRPTDAIYTGKRSI